MFVHWSILCDGIFALVCGRVGVHVSLCQRFNREVTENCMEEDDDGKERDDNDDVNMPEPKVVLLNTDLVKGLFKNCFCFSH